jgi:hypothetical protein
MSGPSIAPSILWALLLRVLWCYSVRSERSLVQQIDYNFLFRWLVGLSMDDAAREPPIRHFISILLADGTEAEDGLVDPEGLVPPKKGITNPLVTVLVSMFSVPIERVQSLLVGR